MTLLLEQVGDVLRGDRAEKPVALADLHLSRNGGLLQCLCQLYGAALLSIGDGVYRSTDGGDTWEHRGLSASGRIGRVIVHPTDPEIVYAAALGHLYGPQEERGIFRTTDGGDSWERVLFVDANSGGVDVVMDPNNPQILFAATWQMFIRTWGRWSGGPWARSGSP